MDRRVVTVGTLVVLAIAGIATAVPGVGPLGGASEATPASAPSAGSASGGGATEASGPLPFSFKLLAVEECGTTCRDVTLRLDNQQDETASDVTVLARIYAGNGTDGDVLWSNEREIGTIEAGGSAISTERVSLGPFDAAKLEASGGWMTVLITVKSADETVDLTRRLDVR